MTMADVNALIEKCPYAEIATCGEILLSGLDVSTLNPNTWLNDQVINGYMSLIATNYRDVAALDVFFFQCLVSGKSPEKFVNRDLFNKGTILVPVIYRIHWTLLVIHEPEATIHVYNSMTSGGRHPAEMLRRYMNSRGDASYVVRTVEDLPQQTNNEDCGVFALCLAAGKSGKGINFAPSIAKTIVFSNVYCYMCSDQIVAVPETCHLQEFDSGRSVNLMTLLDLTREYPRSRSNYKELKTTNDETCEEGMIFDTFLGVCKKLYCPVLTVPVDGGCVQFVEKANGFQYSVDIQLVSDEENKQLDVDENGIVYVYNFIKKRLKLGKCALCGGDMYVSRDNTIVTVTDIYVKLALVTSPECTRGQILSNVAMLEISNFTAKMRFRNNWMRFVGYVREPWKWEVTQWDLVSTFGKCRLTEALNSDRRSNCPRIQLTSGEYYRVLHNHKRAKELLFLWNPSDVNGTVYVCLEIYLDKPRGTGVAKHISLATIIAMVSVIMLKVFVSVF